MSLIREIMRSCVKMVAASQSDGVLGHLNDWQPSGEEFMAAIIRQDPKAGLEAEKPTFHDEYIVVVPTGTLLAFHDVFKRKSDGAVFRVTGDVRDTQAPAISSEQISKTTAERWILE